MFSLKLLGRARIDGPAGALAGRASFGQRLALLAALAVSRDRGQSRDKLIALLWPEAETSKARHLLADSVYLIRKELGEAAVLSVGDDLLLNAAAVQSDVGNFEEALARGHLGLAVELYAGPLLDGFHVADAPGFERWLDGERDRLARAYAEALEELAAECAAVGDRVGAARWWRRLAAHEPYNARITMELMRALEAAGDRAGALQHAGVYARLLSEELDLEPEAEVARLAESIRAAPEVSPAAGHGGLPADPEVRAPPASPSGERDSAPASGKGEGGAQAQPTGVDATDRDGMADVPGGTLGPWPRPGLRRRVAGAVLLLAAAMLAYLWIRPVTPEATPTDIRSLAVLPFDNLSGDAGQEYVADGMTEALTASLARLRGIRVPSRTSAMRFRGSDQLLPEIARALGVDALLEGSVQRADGRLRVNVQLIHGPTDTHLWGGHYQGEATDILKLQEEVARGVVEQIRVRLSVEEEARLSRTGTSDPAAYEQFIIGRYHFWRFNEEDLRRAIEAFERAVRLDPEYADAYAGLARAWWARGIWGSTGPQAAESPAREAARRALELNDRLAEAYVVQADILRLYDLDWAGAENAVRNALELDPDNVEAHHTYALLLMALGRHPEAIAHIEAAERLDPLAPAVQSSFGRILYRARRFEEAIPRLERAIELDPRHRGSYSRLAELYEAMGWYEEALDAFERAPADAREAPSNTAIVARIHARMGRHTEARRLLEELEAVPGGAPLVGMAGVYAALGDRDEAIDLLFRNVEQRSSLPIFINVDPPFDDLHSHPRWRELLRRMNLLE